MFTLFSPPVIKLATDIVVKQDTKEVCAVYLFVSEAVKQQQANGTCLLIYYKD